MTVSLTVLLFAIWHVTFCILQQFTDSINLLKWRHSHYIISAVNVFVLSLLFESCEGLYTVNVYFRMHTVHLFAYILFTVCPVDVECNGREKLA